MKKIMQFWPLILATLLLSLPLLTNPRLFLERGNDLEVQFWPMYHYTFKNYEVTGQLPLWNSLIFSGTPLVSDPQAPLFYLPTQLLSFLPLNLHFIVAIVVHTLAASVFFYMLSHYIVKLSRKASLLSAIVYILLPRFSAFLEAGHIGLIYAYTWIPLVFYSSSKIIRKPSPINAILLALSLAMIFFTHTITFIIVLFAIIIVLIAELLYFTEDTYKKKAVFTIISAFILLFGYICVAFLPQIEWSRYSTRLLLLQTKEIYPVWGSKLEFIKSLFFPWINGINLYWSKDTEKIITLGIVPSLLAFVGFLKTGFRVKIFVVIASLTILLLSLGNASPLFNTLLNQSWYILMRVTTRPWIIMIVIFSILVGYGFDILSNNRKRLGILLGIAAVSELIVLSWIYLAKTPPVKTGTAPQALYELLKLDAGRYRVYCTTGCIPQKEATQRSLELVDGYNTLAQMNYYHYAWQYTGQYWNYYTLAIPPFGIRQFTRLNPDANALGLLNTKYVISPYQLTNTNLDQVADIEGYFLYRNNQARPRAFIESGHIVTPVEIAVYSPNRIVLNTRSIPVPSTIVLSEVYSPGWYAVINGKTIEVNQAPAILRSIDLTTPADTIEVMYKPPLYLLGKIVTMLSIIGSLIYLGIYAKTVGIIKAK